VINERPDGALPEVATAMAGPRAAHLGRPPGVMGAPMAPCGVKPGIIPAAPPDSRATADAPAPTS
jgi:hypothetical protein